MPDEVRPDVRAAEPSPRRQRPRSRSHNAASRRVSSLRRSQRRLAGEEHPRAVTVDEARPAAQPAGRTSEAADAARSTRARLRASLLHPGRGQILANGLWEAGAEAVSINGHRLSNLTAIRSAGDAITVDYRSLTRPYRVEAIGDLRTLQAGFVESSAGAWWNDLAQNRQMRYEISDVKQLDLAADPGIVLRHAGRAAS